MKKSHIHEACALGQADILSSILSSSRGGEGVDVNKCDLHGYSPLYIACEKGHTDCVSLLLEHHAIDVNLCVCGWSPYDLGEDNEWSPLHIACKRGHIDCVKLLLTHQAIVVNQYANNDKTSPLHVAVESGHSDCVSLLINHHADINQSDAFDCTPLYMGCKNGHYDCVVILLDHCADVHRSNAYNSYPLHVASSNGFIDICLLLIKAGANLYALNNPNQYHHQKTALDIYGERVTTTTITVKKLHRSLMELFYNRECRWKRRRSFLMCLTSCGYLSNDDNMAYLIKTRNDDDDYSSSCSNSLFQMTLLRVRIFSNCDLIRYITSYL